MSGRYKVCIKDLKESSDNISTNTPLLHSLDASFAKIDIPEEEEEEEERKYRKLIKQMRL